MRLGDVGRADEKGVGDETQRAVDLQSVLNKKGNKTTAPARRAGSLLLIYNFAHVPN